MITNTLEFMYGYSARKRGRRMTNEEAIEILKLYKQRLEESVSTELGSDIQSFEMAIQSLEQTDVDLISRQAVINKIAILSNEQGNKLVEAIKDIPSAEKTAEWVYRGNSIICSNCGEKIPYGINNHYCRNCGRRMKESEEKK